MRFFVERQLRTGEDLRRTRPSHRLYWRRMAHEKILLYGGAWAGGQGDTLLLQVDDHAALRSVLGGDPYVRERIVLSTRARELDEVFTGGSAAPAGPHVPDAGRPEIEAGELSAHERRLTRMMLDGLTNQQMAERLRVSPRAVEQHITRIYRKLDISRRAQLAVALHGRPPVAA
ncbi:helix-turn-helix transcriptional regulator [Streptomyces sp. NPDC044780]|uniref:Helix-turn-helix transcriptional regulator n=1 Tax=Streptomyces luomodiensis TaxID=3026192 RepID=A0ABY9USW0_9ACTN|nr:MULTISPECIES: helix-turn-helix transcriptional regulator [unclassified Streptomyces]WAP55144.1 helix-turn-helix transcriptional regulator [Streptomyces sp. S465]WNE95652.1 helix-turn-helix transcriptional regulator [Streptomyces sp. SCA4-21]